MTPSINTGKTAVVLSGGGANGAYEVGVLKALCAGKSKVTQFQPLDPDIFSGTSIGSFNAALLVSRSQAEDHCPLEQLEKIWLDVIPKDGSTDHNHVFRFRADPFEFLGSELMSQNPLVPMGAFANDAAFLAQDWLNRGLQFLKSREPVERRTLELMDISTLISNEPETRLLAATIDAANLLRSPKVLKMAATNWDSGELTVFTNHSGTDPGEVLMPEALVPQAILASTAIPGVFPSVEIDGAHYVDGGVVMNTPLTPAVRAGAETLHLIYLDPNVANIPLGALQSTLDVMSRLLTIQFASKMNSDIAAARRINQGLTALEKFRQHEPPGSESPDMTGVLGFLDGLLSGQSGPFKNLTIHRYHPRDDVSGVLGLLDFNRNRIARLMDRGYKDAVEHDCRASQCVMPDGSYAA